jgi:hypothetical protein
MTKLKVPTECSICGGPIDVHQPHGWVYGHNAQPVNDGRCCSECNSMVVIPARLQRIYGLKSPRLVIDNEDHD